MLLSSLERSIDFYLSGSWQSFSYHKHTRSNAKFINADTQSEDLGGKEGMGSMPLTSSHYFEKPCV